jgi:citrate lyase subunit beta/citryl-CoA lyase
MLAAAAEPERGDPVGASEQGRAKAMAEQAHIIRSLIFVPAHDPDRIRDAAKYGADAICLDLEDLTPLEQKEEARRLFPEIAAELAALGVTVFARTNGLKGDMASKDLEAIVGTPVHCVSLPKVISAEEVRAYGEILDTLERERGLDLGSILVRPIVENALGIKFAYEIATASPRVAYMGGVAGGFWGDISSSLGFLPTVEGKETFYLRSKVLVDVRAAGVPYPIGGGPTKDRSLDQVRAFALENKQLGYDGMHCGSEPEIIEVVNEVFSPDPASIKAWAPLVPRLEEAEQAGLNSVVLDGVFMDLAGLPRVRDQIALARRLGMAVGD